MRLLGVGVALILTVVIYFLYKHVFKSDKVEKETGKARQCQRDDDCPDRMLCDDHGTCVSADFVHPVRQVTDGRGRAGEGEDQRVTFSKQTQR